MAEIKWTESMTIGIPFVDADHRTLVRLLNQVQDSIGDAEEYGTLGSVLRALADYTESHFAREEEMLRGCGYRDLPAHAALHARLAERVRGISQRYEVDRASVRGAEVLDFLTEWLTEHILTHDMAYRVIATQNIPAQLSATAVTMDRGRQRRPLDWSLLRVLVVDDNTNFCVLLRTILQGMGVEDIHFAQDGAVGMEVLSRTPVDVVLSDWYMQKMDGLQFVARIRASDDPAIRDLPVVMMSGRGDKETRANAKEAGVDEFIEKPISARDLILVLARIMGA